MQKAGCPSIAIIATVTTIMHAKHTKHVHAIWALPCACANVGKRIWSIWRNLVPGFRSWFRSRFERAMKAMNT